MGRRLRTRAELLAAWRREAEAVAAAEDERSEALAAARLDAADPALGAPWTPDAVVRTWSREVLHVEFRSDDPVPVEVLGAFRRAQAALWAGTPLPDDLTLLVDDPADTRHRSSEPTTGARSP